MLMLKEEMMIAQLMSNKNSILNPENRSTRQGIHMTRILNLRKGALVGGVANIPPQMAECHERERVRDAVNV